MNKIKSLALLILEIGVISFILYYMRGALEHSHHHEINTILPILLDIAFLAFFASFGGRVAKLFGVAPMAGKIVMGIIAGPAALGVLLPDAMGVEVARLAGVLFILFEAGLHFDMELLKKNAAIASLVAFVGVLIPLVSFALLGHYVFHLEWVPAVFLGGVFTATSVGLAVEALKRAGMLQGSLGNKIVGAAVIDDILGVVILTTLSKISGGGELEVMAFVWLAISVLGFLAGAYAFWSWGIADKIAKYLDRHYVKTTTGAYTRFFFGAVIIGGALAAVIGLEPVLGAFAIGVVLSKVDNEIKHEAWEKIEGYMHIFVGGFLVSIGTMLPRESLVSLKVWGLAILFTVLAFYGKYLVRYLFKNKEEGKLVGYAMTIRGEVGLVFIAVALSNNALDETFGPAALLAVILVTIWGAIVFQKQVEKVSGKKMDAPEEAI
ncbi:cation:proton antiporter [Patescibacteria group bacterium]|nr:cation:proton antiporter [Patescibacteria group bacterium]MBU1896007.1 cation:proton antiporter [Patescibacteria group bacterium]